MNIVWMILIGMVGGIFGGMGMGGGTVLVPLLSMLGIEQISLQGITLVSFVPMSIIAIIIHNKHKRIEKKCCWIIIPAVCATVVASIFAHKLSNKVLTVMYGAVLLLVGIWQIIVAIKAMVNTARRNKRRLIVVQCPSGILRAKTARSKK